jgi:hypothetical protein
LSASAGSCPMKQFQHQKKSEPHILIYFNHLDLMKLGRSEKGHI